MGILNEELYVVVPQETAELKVVKVWVPPFSKQICRFYGIQTLMTNHLAAPWDRRTHMSLLELRIGVKQLWYVKPFWKVSIYFTLSAVSKQNLPNLCTNLCYCNSFLHGNYKVFIILTFHLFNPKMKNKVSKRRG